MVDPRVSDEQLAALAEGGVRGIRWNLVSGACIPEINTHEVQRFLARIRAHGMHLEVHLESDRLAPILAPLAWEAQTLVIDHIGRPVSSDPKDEPWLNRLAQLTDRTGIFVKLSAPYRCGVDPLPHIERLLDLLPPEQFLWGSDWPHTNYENQASFAGYCVRVGPLIDDRSAAERVYSLAHHRSAQGPISTRPQPTPLP